MRKFWFVILSILVSPQTNAQKPDFRKNTVSIETGIFHRGIFGLSYSRNFFKSEFTFFSADVYAGLGYDFNQYAGIGSDINLGRDEVFFSIGVDIKYFNFGLPSALFTVNGYKGFSYSPHIGLSLYIPAGLTSKLRLGFLPAYDDGEIVFTAPVIGLSIGKSF